MLESNDKNVRDLLPNTLNISDICLYAKLPFGSDLSSNSLDFRGESDKLVDHIVDCLDEVQDLSADDDFVSKFLGKITDRYGSLQLYK